MGAGGEVVDVYVLGEGEGEGEEEDVVEEREEEGGGLRQRGVAGAVERRGGLRGFVVSWFLL